MINRLMLLFGNLHLFFIKQISKLILWLFMCVKISLHDNCGRLDTLQSIALSGGQLSYLGMHVENIGTC